jgi:hypothetical protein
MKNQDVLAFAGLALMAVMSASCGKSVAVDAIGSTNQTAPPTTTATTVIPTVPTTPGNTNRQGSCATQDQVHWSFVQPQPTTSTHSSGKCRQPTTSSYSVLYSSFQLNGNLDPNSVEVTVDQKSVPSTFNQNSDIVSISQVDAGEPGSVIDVDACRLSQ